jgi:hypothetical protein
MCCFAIGEDHVGATNMFGLFRKKQKVEIEDPLFGHLEFQSIHGVDLWCHVPSQPGGHMVVIVAPSTGPTHAQRDFYASLREQVFTRESECKAFIATHDEYPANLAGMSVYCVEIGPDEELQVGRFVVELSDAEAYEIHRVEFENGKPKTYGVDD